MKIRNGTVWKPGTERSAVTGLTRVQSGHCAASNSIRSLRYATFPAAIDPNGEWRITILV